MNLDDKDLLFKITRSRDKRYDGRFYCGVKTTGIYCRPICPARANAENLTYYKSSAEAENAGFRPCLRCRPHLAPHSVQWNGTAALVGRALTMVNRGDADEISFEAFAQKLGVTDRHLRRLFQEHVGATPGEVATSKRLHLAKHLLTQSSLTVTETAFASGYKSIRRFNDAFKQKFKSSPTTLRKSSEFSSRINTNFINVEIPVIAPYDWPHILGFLSNHKMETIEDFSHGRFRRCFSIDGSDGAIDVSFDQKKCLLRGAISISNPIHLRVVIEKVRDLFDTRANPHSHFTDLILKDDITLCYQSELGIRIPGAWDSFETAVGIILGQLVSIEQARLKIRKLIEKFGTPIRTPTYPECHSLFPSPKVLSQANLKDLGITKIRESAIRELARQVYKGELDLSRSGDIEKSRSQLLEIKGIGQWTTELIAMRCLGDVNAFPKTDLIVKRALQHHRLEKGNWSPWNAYIALALWKKYAKVLSKKK